MKKYYAVYIITNKRNGTVYVGMTGDLVYRIQQHKQRKIPGFTKKHSLDTLVYYELHENPNDAILREKRIKEWKRQWKLELIEKENPDWNDLYDDIEEKGIII